MLQRGAGSKAVSGESPRRGAWRHAPANAALRALSEHSDRPTWLLWAAVARALGDLRALGRLSLHRVRGGLGLALFARHRLLVAPRGRHRRVWGVHRGCSTSSECRSVV